MTSTPFHVAILTPFKLTQHAIWTPFPGHKFTYLKKKKKSVLQKCLSKDFGVVFFFYFLCNQRSLNTALSGKHYKAIQSRFTFSCHQKGLGHSTAIYPYKWQKWTVLPWSYESEVISPLM